MDTRPIPGASGYFARSDGSIISHRRWKYGHALKQNISTRGRPRVSIYYDGQTQPTVEQVAYLIARCFLPPRPDGQVLRHLNDIPTDNRVENLAWGTNSENGADAVKNGKNAQSNKTHCPDGHEYTAENTYWVRRKGRNPTRDCRKCITERHRKAKARWREKKRHHGPS